MFKKHNLELLRFYTAFHNAHGYTYKALKASNASWDQKPAVNFDFTKRWESKQFNDLKDWSDAFNQAQNWVNLNALMAIVSTLETYIATIIPMALESDVGVLFGVSRRIDGITIYKYGKEKPFNFEDAVESVTKGAWEGRINAYRRLFDQVPRYLESKLSDLERTRVLRNKIGHAFGRDIDASRKHGELTTLPITKLSREQLLNYQRTCWYVARSIDRHILQNHVGEFTTLLFYHKLFPSLNHSVHQSMRAIEFKRAIGRYGETPLSKDFCKELVAYYESL